MNCRHTEPLLIDHLSGQLAEAKAQQLQEHLAGCAACRQRLATWSACRRTAVALPQSAPSPGLVERALASWQVAQTPGPRVAWLRAAPWVTAAALGVVVVTIAVGYWRPSSGAVRLAGTIRLQPNIPTPPRPHLPPLGVEVPEAKQGALTPDRPATPRLQPYGKPELSAGALPPPGREGIASSGQSDAEYLDGRDPALGSWMLTGDSRDEIARAWLEQRLPPMKDDFVRLQLPLLASADLRDQAVREALQQAEKEARVVDARLFAKVTLQLKGVSLDELCRELEQQTKVRLRASRGVQDEKVTVLVKEKPARDVLRAVARLFGYLWNRQGEEGRYHYVLTQDLRSQLAEQEMRDRDLNAALVGLDEAMKVYAPYAEQTVEQLRDRLRDARGTEKERISELVRWGGWGALQVYRTLSPADFAALRTGGKVRYGFTRFDANRLPDELLDPIMQAFDTENIAGGERYREPGVKPWVTFSIDRSELGQATLKAEVGVSFPDGKGIGHLRNLATSRSPSTANPDNAEANKALKAQPPFTRKVILKPRPSCPHFSERAQPPSDHLRRADPLAAQPHVTSADVWEEVHRATGLPIVADSYMSLYPVAAVTVEQKPLFEALCTLGKPLRVRWRQDGDFLLARSTSYFWDKLKEVPKRQLQRWQETRRNAGHLPLEQVLEIAALSDHQLNSREGGRAVEHCWGIREWGILGEGLPREVVRQIPSETRPYFRLLTLLNPAQLRQAQSPEGLPLPSLAPAHQQEVARLEVSLLNTAVHAVYVPGGWHLWRPSFPRNSEYRDFRVSSRLPVVAHREPEAALAAARRIFAGAAPGDILKQEGTLAVWFTNADGVVVRDKGKPSIRFTDAKRGDE